MFFNFDRVINMSLYVYICKMVIGKIFEREMTPDNFICL